MFIILSIFHSNFRSNTASFIHYSFNLVCKASYLECWLSLFYIPHGKLKRVPVQRPSNYCDISVPRWNIDQILIENLTNACRRMLWRHRCGYRQITLYSRLIDLSSVIFNEFYKMSFHYRLLHFCMNGVSHNYDGRQNCELLLQPDIVCNGTQKQGWRNVASGASRVPLCRKKIYYAIDNALVARRQVFGLFVYYVFYNVHIVTLMQHLYLRKIRLLNWF